MARRTVKSAPVEAAEVEPVAEVEESAPVEATDVEPVAEVEESAPVEAPVPAVSVVIRCEKFPSLLVTSPRVEFVDGLATVTEEVAQVLLGLSPEFGLVRVDPVGE